MPCFPISAVRAASVAIVASALGATSVAAAAETETRSVAAVRETVPVATPGDAADDPAVWRDPLDPDKSLIVATDKEWGLHVYDLSGALRASTPAGRVNNVDVRADVLIDGRPVVLVAASDRSDDSQGQIALYALETSPVGLRHLGNVAVEGDGDGKVYGLCLWRRSAGEIYAFIPFNNGDVRQYTLDLQGSVPTAALVRDTRLASQAEGCVVDDRTGLAYVAEEKHGVWRINAAPESDEAPMLFAPVDGVRLIPDVEGLAIFPRGAAGGFLLVSSQADNAADPARRNDSAFVAYDLASGRFVQRFRVDGSGGVDGASDTDGVEFAPGDFGAPFEDGLLVVQDGDNAPDNQNFKMVPGRALRELIERK